jgi:thiol:disulfide interchange protein DsbD
MRNASRSFVALAIAGGLVTGTPARAQEHPITFSLRATSARNPAAGRLQLKLGATIPYGWHLYSLTEPPGGPIATSIAVLDPFAPAGMITAPPPDVLPDRNFQIMTESYSDSVTFTIPVKASTKAKRVRVSVHYQTCTDRYCLPPTSDTVETVAAIRASGDDGIAPGRPVAAPSPPLASVSAGTARPRLGAVIVAGAPAVPQSLWLFAWLAITTGLLSLLTPCVFPMVPITVSYFSNRASRGGGRAAVARGALLYAGGIVAAFTGLGLAATTLFGSTGLNRLAADPWLNLGITALFVVFALGLFGWVNLTLPSTLINRIDAVGRGAGDGVSTLLMGLTFALTSFTCTAPFVGTLLVTASQGNWRWPALGLALFSATFALPFVVLALVPGWLARLPKGGAWMVSLKTAMGFLELAAAVKFLSNADLVWGWHVFTRDVVLWLWCAIGLALALYLAGVLRVERHFETPPAGWARRLAAAAIVLVCLRLSFGLGGGRLGELDAFLPPISGAAGEGTASGELAWITNDLAAGLTRARAERKPVLIDFTGYTCTNCRWMEANMFPRPAVRDELVHFVRVRLFTDGVGEPYREQQSFERTTFKTVALPLYAVVDTSGEARGTFLGMTRDPDEFVRFLTQTRGVPGGGVTP